MLVVPFFINAKTTYTEQQKINHLIAYIRILKDATFIRNGSEHTAIEAADHLKMKLGKAGDKIKTAEDFIEKIASVSSITGEPYKIKFADGKEYTCGVILRMELKRLEDGKVKLLN